MKTRSRLSNVAIDKLKPFDKIRQNTERWMAKGIIVRNLDVTLMSERATHVANTSIRETTDGDVTRLTIDLEMSLAIPRVSILFLDARALF